MRRLALLSVLSDKARQSDVLLLDSLELKEGKTKEIVSILSALNVSGPTLIVTDGPNKKLVQSAGNVGGVRTLPVQVLNTLDLLNKKQLIITVDAVKRIEEIWGGVYKGDGDTNDVLGEDNRVVEETQNEPHSIENSKAERGETDQPKMSDLGLSTRTNNLLIQAEITEMDDLTSLSKSELLNIPGFGEKSYLEVREKLESLNILPSDWE
jgi:hypothetical protein